MPMLVRRMQVGGSFGAAAGLVLMENLPVEWNIQPGIYAIVGATAMLGGVFRSSISLVCGHLPSLRTCTRAPYTCTPASRGVDMVICKRQATVIHMHHVNP